MSVIRHTPSIRLAHSGVLTATFSRDRLQRFPEDHLPTAQVYGSTNRAELSAITCASAFDQDRGHYLDNVVAFAHLVGSARLKPSDWSQTCTASARFRGRLKKKLAAGVGLEAILRAVRLARPA